MVTGGLMVLVFYSGEDGERWEGKWDTYLIRVRVVFVKQIKKGGGLGWAKGGFISNLGQVEW